MLSKKPVGYAVSWIPDTSVKTQLDAANHQMPYPMEVEATLAFNAYYRTLGVSPGYIPMRPINFPPAPPNYAGFTFEKAGLGYFYIGIQGAGYLFWNAATKSLGLGSTAQAWRVFKVGENQFLILNDTQGKMAMLVPPKMMSTDAMNPNNPQFMSGLAKVTLAILSIQGTNISPPGLWKLFWT